jgi:glycosyltransferase involved in cell wall biosynthesis
MTEPVTVTYLSNDALTEGVGASQVLAYVERIAARGVHVRLHSFEKDPPTPALEARLASAQVEWRPHRFGRHGALGGAWRVVEAAVPLRAAAVVHARADLAAASALLARPKHWVWDCRGLYADQRIALGSLRAGSPEHRVLARVERAAARGSDAIITLTAAVVPVLATRHGDAIPAKTTVITTCVDTKRFLAAPPPPEPARLLLAGTINRFYDVPAMLSLVDAMRRRRPTELALLTPPTTAWDDALAAAAPVRLQAVPHDAMPELLATAHAGLSVCRDDAGISLTGSMPTKIAEFLAVGRPVVVNRALGDASALVREHRVGVVVEASTRDGIERAADELTELLEDRDAPRRCRALALEHFDLDRAADRLVEIYRRIAAS